MATWREQVSSVETGGAAAQAGDPPLWLPVPTGRDTAGAWLVPGPSTHWTWWELQRLQRAKQVQTGGVDIPWLHSPQQRQHPPRGLQPTWLVHALHRYTQVPSPTLSTLRDDQSTRFR